jgi:transposase
MCISRRPQCYEWFKRFEEGRISVGEDPRPGRPSTLTNDDHVERVRVVIRGNRRLTARDVADEVDIKHRTLPLKFLLKNFRCVASVQNSCRVC